MLINNVEITVAVNGAKATDYTEEKKKQKKLKINWRNIMNKIVRSKNATIN